ncbi:MAG: hypothetical protein PUB29_12290 [Bacteroidales bacterium]|nr:hypothetical protein [Bacteroidales bacterium]
MKKVIAIFGAALLFAGVATSCSKVCECTTSITGMPDTVTEVNLENTNVKKCSDMNSEVTLAGVTTKTVCKRK